MDSSSHLEAAVSGRVPVFLIIKRLGRAERESCFSRVPFRPTLSPSHAGLGGKHCEGRAERARSICEALHLGLRRGMALGRGRAECESVGSVQGAGAGLL